MLFPLSLAAQINSSNVEEKFADLLRQLPPIAERFDDQAEAELALRLKQEQDYREFLGEKVQDKWFAALVAHTDDGGYSIVARFESWKGLLEFFVEQDALVEVWAYPEKGKVARRIPATELGAFKKQRREQPTFITATWQDPQTQALNIYRVEFGFAAAEMVAEASRGYQKQREIQLVSREVLSARDAQGRLNAKAQWAALVKAVKEGRLPMAEIPPEPADPQDVFVAFEYEVDKFNNFARALRIYRNSEIQRRIVWDEQGRSTQVLLLRTAGITETREATGFRVRGLSDELEPAPSPVLGQDVVELRVKNPNEPDVRRWNVLEFGEPELVKQSALAKFSLINANLDKRRKEIAIKKSRLDLIAEPIFAGLNIGGGVSGVPFPLGEAARLGYNAAVAPWFIPDVPTVKEMRELFRLIAAKDRHPELKTKPGDFLDDTDLKKLKESARNLTDQDVVEFLQYIDEEDLKAMLRLAKMQQIDARVSNLLSIVADAGKVSAWTDQEGFQRDVFNSIYFSVTGEVSIKNIIAVLAGGEVATPNSGHSLEMLSRGHGPAEAWLQFLNVTVDIRAVINQVARLSYRNLANKELKKPFPYAPRMTDLAAYEVRIFGFPLLIFYKRGLLKDDYQSYVNDYAYGLVGATIVEHFRTREEMDAEIRAGRMFPLGYVRVPDGIGRWKESNLAVFAHRIPSGKHKGKTAIIIYGLKAYQEHSRLVEREYLRFKQFEQGLQEGMVIEKVVNAEDREQIPSTELESKFHVGAQAGEEHFDWLLGGLQELRRYWQHRTWKLPMDTNEVELIAGIFEDLTAKDIRVDDRNPLLGVDRHNSSFEYRRYVGGKWREVRVTLIPGREEIQREVSKAEEGERIQRMRREAVSSPGEGIVLIHRTNRVPQRQDQYEIGPFIQDKSGEVIGAGVRGGAKAVEEIFAKIAQLPVTDRARLVFNNFSSTVVDLDIDDDGHSEPVFITVEFPIDKFVQREWTNPFSGEGEILAFKSGRWISAVTDRRILEIDYDEKGSETASRLYFNAGTRAQPQRGALLEKTRTTERWSRNLSQPNIDPYLPTISKLKLNYVTGQITREVYGLFPLPVSTIDERFITENRFNAYGVFQSAKVTENLNADTPVRALLAPTPGAERIVLSSTLPPEEMRTLRDLKDHGYKSSVQTRDVIRGLSRLIVVDHGNFGRKVSESWLDLFDGGMPFTVSSLLEYRDDFFFGLIPFKTSLQSGSNAVVLSQVETKSYDSLSRQLTGTEVDYTGRSLEKVWDWRWANSVEVKSRLRKTTTQHSRDETSFTGTTVDIASGEELASFAGKFDAATKTWSVHRTWWYRPGITNRTEVETLSGFGKHISTRHTESLETRLTYNTDGMEVARRTFGRNPLRTEDDYQWREGGRSARVQTYVDGKDYDSFAVETDSDGRLVNDGIRRLPGLELRTVITYDSGSDRVLRTEEFQNSKLRVVRHVEPEQKDSSLQVVVVPHWGLIATQIFLIGDPIARPVATRFENGESARTTEWFEQTAVARVTEVLDRHGRAKERYVRRLNQSTNDGTPFDITTRHKLSHWATSGLAEEIASIRGTDITLFKDAGEERIFYDLTKPYPAPLYAVDLLGEQGMNMRIGQTREPNVVTLFRVSTNQTSMVVDAVDLRGLFFHQVGRKLFDGAGRLLEERIGQIPNPGENGDNDEAIVAAAAQSTPTKAFKYHYQRGWLVEQTDPQTGGRLLRFTSQEPAPETKSILVNDGRWPDFPTQIDGQLVSTNAKNFVFRRSHSPRELERNPHLPGRADAWTAWTSTELGTDGEKLFDSETIYDAQGRPSVVKSIKTTSSGKPAFRFTYHLSRPNPEILREIVLQPGEPSVSLDADGLQDFSKPDFVYFYVQSESNPPLVVTDGSGRQAVVSQTALNDRPKKSKGEIAPWFVHRANASWFPVLEAPQYATSINAPADLIKNLVVLSVNDLDTAGLDVRRINSFNLLYTNPQRGPLKVSPVYTLTGNRESLSPRPRRELAYGHQLHTSGLRVFATRQLNDSTTRRFNDSTILSAVAEFNGSTVAFTRGRAAHAEYPRIVITDPSDPDHLRPLYAVSLEAGHFLEHYKVVKRGDAQVYTIVSGFELPRFEVFSAKRLADEITPGYIAYGQDYSVAIRYARGRGPIGYPLAYLHNRIVANAFRYGGDKVLGNILSHQAPDQHRSQFDFEALHEAKAQAADIKKLPMLAEALLPTRPLPWQEAQSFTSAPTNSLDALTNDWASLALELDKLHFRHRLAGFPYSLIPTTLDTIAERYVDTAAEANLIILAVKLGQLPLALDLLEFYWEKSQAGRQALHASYDAQAGTAMTGGTRYERPLHARRTAKAQLAIAEAAITLGLESGHSNWFTLGRNLLSLTLTNFRASLRINGEPRGITEYEFLPVRRAYGFTLWPDAELYSLDSNARAYLLLKRLHTIRTHVADTRWRFEIAENLDEQEAWLKTHILPYLEQSGVVPNGLFQIQDIHRKNSALGMERWTSADDWLTFLEAAHEMGIAPQKIHRWLENLARTHGVRVNGVWGLDWSIALVRPDAISSELTARFWRVATLVGHTQAVAFAAQSLQALSKNGRFPAAITEAPTNLPLQLGQGLALYPRTNASTVQPRSVNYQPSTSAPWPDSLGTLREFLGSAWDLSKVSSPIETISSIEKTWPRPRTDLAVFVLITAGFYLAILFSAIFWRRFRALRRKQTVFPDPLVPETVLQRAEERWAKRVLGMQVPDGAEKTRYSNAPIEQNFLMQLRTIYKLVLEWRRQENGWAEDDVRLIEDESDSWLNGLDEFACTAGIYMRFVIKAGVKDGFSKKDLLAENEDSNHIWSRLVMYFSECYWGLLTLMQTYSNFVIAEDKRNLYGQMSQLLTMIGLRQRTHGFDARKLFNFPADPEAMDLLLVQKPGMTLDKLMFEVSEKLKIPYEHLLRVIQKYKEFKKREDPYPIHPYVIELARVMPHFIFMGVGALIWYNQSIGDSPIVPYLWKEVIVPFADSWLSLTWAVPLFAGLLLSVASHLAKIYRFDAPMLRREKTELFLDATLTSFFARSHSVMPQARTGRWWNPHVYEWSAWCLRTIGFTLLAIALLQLETPSFATFLIVKGLLAMLALAEVAAIVFPLAGTALSKFLQDLVTKPAPSGSPPAFLNFLNRLNITATRPASPLWLSVKYHTQPSVPTGGFWGAAQAVIFYFVLAASFFFVGAYLCQQIFSLWITDTYLQAADWKLVVGGLLFWNTMYLLRYGLFLLFTGIASALATFPIKTGFALLALAHLVLTLFGHKLDIDWNAYPMLIYSFLVFGLVLMTFEKPLIAWWQKVFEADERAKEREEQTQQKLQQIKNDKSAVLGIVYMSGDDLSYHKLTPNLLMERWSILRDKLDSEGIRLLSEMARCPDDPTLKQWFQNLYDTEKKFDVTLWHPLQVVVNGAATLLRPELGLNIRVENLEQRDQLLTAWHLRRWLVTMMSTAGHSQDTAVNLVDIALRLDREGLSANTAFYLIQNKYDNNENNRPSQTPYNQGELAQRNKLARLLTEIAPWCRAYSLQNWTPFGFKAGGLTAMDLAHEESLRLTTLLLLDRNATVHDLDALMQDLTTALTEPEVVIIIPGRGSTNTLTPLGQASQMVEEGHRSFLKGLMALLGGTASEDVGTGWGNILAGYYGRVQRALVDAHTLKMPLTSRMRRGSSFQVRTEGLIGFTPHAVGISEDTWAVSQTAHNAIALGHRVKFLHSRAFWHKIRETWSHSEWLASFPRWSGGYLQMMHDPLMQRINDFGPKSIFAKEVRANSGRNFLSAPFALLNILLMPLAIMLDVTPFVQILIVLWNFGFIMNQVLTLHGLNTYLESSGFYRIPAVTGAAIAGLLSLLLPDLQRFAPGLIMLGFLTGGFFVGLSRWFYTRIRDVLLFGPQLVLHTLGQMVRQTLEFTVSGASPEDAKGVDMAYRAWAGPREDRPLDTFPHFINFKTVVWIVGLLSLVLNLFALSNLDLLNVLLLLPSLLFSVSILAGPFLLKPRVGKPIGKWVFVPRLLGWVGAVIFYTAVSLLIARGGSLTWLGVLLLVGVLALLLQRGLRHAGYRRKLRLLQSKLAKLLIAARVKADKSNQFAGQLLQKTAGDPAKVKAELERIGMREEHHAPIMQFADQRIRPMLQSPIALFRRGRFAQNRFASELSRSFVLALLVLIWFLIVPVPGLFVFTAGDYRFSVNLSAIAILVGGVIALVVVASWVGRFIQWFDRCGFIGRASVPASRALQSRSLASRLEKAWRDFQSLLHAGGRLTPLQVASAYALFTDTQTYLDQRSNAYARRSLSLIESILNAQRESGRSD